MGGGVCGSMGQQVNQELQIRGGHEFNLGLSQSRAGRGMMDGQRTDCHVSRLPGSESGILTPPTPITDDSPDPKECLHTQQTTDTGWSGTDMSKASGITFCCDCLPNLELFLT